MNRRLSLLLTLSLTLNILLLGISAGLATRIYLDNPWIEVRRDLSPEARHLFARTTERAHRALESDLDQARSVREKLMRVIAAENFDAQTYDRLTRQLRDHQAAISETKAQALGQMIEDMPPGERVELSRYLANRLGSGPVK